MGEEQARAIASLRDTLEAIVELERAKASAAA